MPKLLEFQGRDLGSNPNKAVVTASPYLSLVRVGSGDTLDASKKLPSEKFLSGGKAHLIDPLQVAAQSAVSDDFGKHITHRCDVA